MDAGRRFRLKAATQVAHERVENIVRGAGMFDSVQGYRRYVQATYEARAVVERQLDAGDAQRIFPSWPQRRLAALIAADLADLEAPAPESSPDIPDEAKMRFVQSAPELLGRLYVLEGSSLGARILTRSADSLGFTADFGARHLHAQAGDAGAWRAFCEALESFDLSPAEEARLFGAADRTFDRFAAAYARLAG